MAPKLALNWDVSYDFDAEDIIYTVEVAKDYLFEDVIFQKRGLVFRRRRRSCRRQGSI